MPTAREALLNAAFSALDRRPWAGVRMVDVAAAAGVSRQTLYNEFGSKDGLARALVRREAEAYLRGVEQALLPVGGARDPGERLAAAAVWTVRAARGNALVRATLTGCWGDRLPVPAAVPRAVPGPRPAGGGWPPDHPDRGTAPARPAFDDPPPPGPPLPRGLPTPVEMVRQVSDRSRVALSADWPPAARAELGRVCETAARLAVSYVVAPVAADEVAALVRLVLVPRYGAGPVGQPGPMGRPGQARPSGWPRPGPGD